MEKFQLRASIDDLTRAYKKLLDDTWQKLQDKRTTLSKEELQKDFETITDVLRTRSRLEVDLELLQVTSNPHD